MLVWRGARKSSVLHADDLNCSDAAPDPDPLSLVYTTGVLCIFHSNAARISKFQQGIVSVSTLTPFLQIQSQLSLSLLATQLPGSLTLVFQAPSAMHALLRLTAVLVLASTAFAVWRFDLDTKSATYSLLVNGAVWMQSKPLVVRVDGQWFGAGPSGERG